MYNEKMIPWIYFITIIVFVIDWAVMGLKIFTNDYDILVEAYIGCVCFIILLVCAVYKIFSNKCPYCGKLRLSGGDYCSYCGKKIDL